MLIAVINQSTLVSNIDVESMCKAVQIQLTQHVLPAWNLKSGTVEFYADKTQVPKNACIVSILNNSMQEGALGFHSIDNDVIDAFIFCKPVLDNGGVVLYDAQNPQNVSVSSVLSHEVLETVGDPYANFWADGPEIPQGSQYALELCDAVQENSYAINISTDSTKPIWISVSNFILPSFFNPQGKNPDDFPFDYLHKLTAPFSMTKGGYQILLQSGQSSQIFGELMPQWRKDQVLHATYRR